ncbi:hypothetical protein [Actinomycetospora soli]|uniref:hypothetical protein n=1 Tax=Actinomycetospora soli TaxID=2893887 RepID=UPI001E4F7C33|nr:hypothetical protein [Actinomycetospora soli]MCD2191221.1 hypothetical protein [Actinomycetospora soli]
MTTTDDSQSDTAQTDGFTPTVTVPDQLAIDLDADGVEGSEAGQGWRSKPEQLWTAFDRSEAYLDTRPVGGPFDPTLDYGHPDWREPESDAEAAARLAHLEADRTARPPTAPELRDRTPVEEALLDAGVEADLAERAQDPDPALWAHYRELAALDRLAPVPVDEIADPLGDDEHDEYDEYDEYDEEEL